MSPVRRLTPFTPEIVEAMPNGRQQVELQLDNLLTGYPLEWEEQRVARFQIDRLKGRTD